MGETTKTINLDLTENEVLDLQNAKFEVVLEHVSELLLEFFKEGKYSYFEYKEDKLAIPDTNRQYKGKIKKLLSDLSGSKSFISEAFISMFHFMYNVDEGFQNQLIKQKRILKQKNKSLQEEINEIKKDIENEIQTRVNNEADSRVQDIYGELKDDLQKSMKRNRNYLINCRTLEQNLDDLRDSKSKDESDLKNEMVQKDITILELKKEINNLRMQSRKGRPKKGTVVLTEKEKKEIKIKKKMAELQKQLELNSSSEEDSTDTSQDEDE